LITENYKDEFIKCHLAPNELVDVFDLLGILNSSPGLSTTGRIDFATMLAMVEAEPLLTQYKRTFGRMAGVYTLEYEDSVYHTNVLDGGQTVIFIHPDSVPSVVQIRQKFNWTRFEYGGDITLMDVMPQIRNTLFPQTVHEP
jgi:hypothetical protein